MARTAYLVEPPRQHRHPALGPPTPFAPGGGGFLIRDTIAVTALGDGTQMLLAPSSYENRNIIEEDAEWRDISLSEASKCWQTTLIYQLIGDHPHLVRFLRPCPWTWLPIFEHPKGPPLRIFIDTNRDEMYELRGITDQSTANGRVKEKYKNLIYQWSLSLASALEYIHSHSLVEPVPIVSIVFGELLIGSCWLTPDLTLKVLGFLDAGFRTRASALHVGDINSGIPFNPIWNLTGTDRKPTLQTDLFMWGVVVYELMTGFPPGEGQGLTNQEACTLVARREWPRLEKEFLGDVVTMCWSGGMKSAAELLATVRRKITELGTGLAEDDKVVDLNIEGLKI